MKILCLDGMNMLHRARSGFRQGDHFVCFNFIRSLRALIEQHHPTRVYMALEGVPKHRVNIDTTYKANRKLEPIGPDASPEQRRRAEELASFFRQVDDVIALMQHIPVTLVRHPDFEADDVVHNLIARSSIAVPWTVVSTDTDFTQLLCEFAHVSVYNPVTKAFVNRPDYDYVTWKALRGDPSDNVPGLPGISDKRAEAIVNDPDALISLFADKALANRFDMNYRLIRFASWSDVEAARLTSSEPTRDWASVASTLESWGFRSMLQERSWERFTSTFEPLWT